MKKFIIKLIERFVSRDLILEVLYIGSLGSVNDYRFIDTGEDFKYRKLCKWLVKHFVGDDLIEGGSYIYNNYNRALCDRRIKMMSSWFEVDKAYLSNRCVYLSSDIKKPGNNVVGKFYKGSSKTFVDHWSVNERLVK